MKTKILYSHCASFLLRRLKFPTRQWVVAFSVAVTSLISMKSSAQSFDIKITNVQKNSGAVVVELFNDKSTWLEKPLKKAVIPSAGTEVTTSFEIPAGKYAISVYQDVDKDGTLDRNFVGIPKEPIGFGNNYKPFGSPKYESAVVEFKAGSSPQTIALFEVF